MVMPVIRELQAYPDLRTEVLALTTAGRLFSREGLPHKGYRDFVTAQDAEALGWGKRLAACHHSAESGVPEEESVAYLGLSYWDLVMRHGEVAAAKLFEKKGREAFFPVSFMERVIRAVQPSMVVTTNSPRSERAAVVAAKRFGLLTLSMFDLFGIQHFSAATNESLADYVTVLSELTVENLRRDGMNKPPDSFLVTGNPAFDEAFDDCGPTDYNWRRTHFPALPADAKWLLWADNPSVLGPLGPSPPSNEEAILSEAQDNWSVPLREIIVRSEAEIMNDLELLNQAASANSACLLIRPHPSQPRGLFEKWIRSKDPTRVGYAGDVPLHPLLRSIDCTATYESTVALQSLLMQRPVIQFEKRQLRGSSCLPLADWGMAWLFDDAASLPEIVREALQEGDTRQSKLAHARHLLPQRKAAPQIAYHIHRIVSSTT
jgi:hypothetical protein